ncbi:Spo0B domain-containing protein [Paenibacillus sp. NEAU-GSW1]|uniref:Spo0B domain-containing protein n=1 Tax=Paenibacillus sp. NEAU-GSW1 TaxID=2682486 RepID=UPI0012E234DA|nr:Spo0B domain-containing protein [Paenibacillus sp. NEAU-GSW1]MUT64537.1 histidine kinase [Paenibacillus sp. NEAU-GSW1]
MDRLTIAKSCAAASVLLPCAAVLIWPQTYWLLAIFLGWLTGAAALWIWAERKENEERIERTIHSLQSSSIRTLNHHRHDWMNDLQVLYGYIRLQKLDKTADYVEKIKDRMAAESQIAKLGVPSLVSYIQSFRTITNSLQLKVINRQDIQLSDWPESGKPIAEALIRMINAYRMGVKSGCGDAAVLTVELSKENDALFASFQYEGELTSEQHLADQIKKQLEGALLLPVDLDRPQLKIVLKAELSA